MPRLSVSTWSLHRALGPMYHPSESDPNQLLPHDDTPGEISLLDVPARIGAMGIKTLEICHFHFPHLDDAYFAELRSALDRAGVNLFSILIDAGDITHPDAARREADLAWIRAWLEIAGKCGAGHARVIAGDTAIVVNGGDLRDHDPIRLSAQNLRALAKHGRDYDVQVITENFRALTTQPAPLLAILDLCQGDVGLCADFGNYKGAGKYEDLAAILPQADSVHAKARYTQPGKIDNGDFRRCLDLSQAAGFDGPYSLIFDDEGSEWDNLLDLRAAVEPYTRPS